MWEHLRRIETLVTIVVGLVAIGGYIAFPEFVNSVIARIRELFEIVLSPIEIPAIVFFIPFLWFLFNTLRILRKRFSRPAEPETLAEPTHEAQYSGLKIRYYIDPKTNLPKVVPPIICGLCNAKVDKLQQYSFDRSSVMVACSNGHEFEKLMIQSGVQPEKLLKFYLQRVSDSFIHQYRENILSENLRKAD